MSITLGFQSYQRRCVRYVFGVQSYLLHGCVMPGVARRISSLHRWPRGDTGSTMEGKVVAVSMWFWRGKPSKPSKQDVNQPGKKNPSLSLRVFRAKKGKQKFQKSNTRQVDCVSWITMAINLKTLKTSPEELLLRGMGFVVWLGWPIKAQWLHILVLGFFFLLLPFLLKGCCQTSSKVKYQMPTMVCFPVSFHLQKWRCFRGFSYLKFTFQGGFFWAGEVSRSLAMEHPTIFETRKDGDVFLFRSW